MAVVVYILCALTALACAVLLLRGHHRTGARLLWWSGLCFACLFVNNALVTVDLILLPGNDLFLLRNAASLTGLLLLLYGLIWESGQ